MKILLAPVLLVISICVSSYAFFPQDSDTTLINEFISKQAAQEGGEEYEDTRKVVPSDLDSDGILDLAFLYTIEGQDGTNSYLRNLYHNRC